MNNKVFDFYEVFKKHGFSEEEMKSVVEGVRELVKDESRDNATKEDINRVIEKINNIDVSMAKRFEYVHEKLYDTHRTTLTWLVTTAIAVTSVVVGLIKLL